MINIVIKKSAAFNKSIILEYLSLRKDSYLRIQHIQISVFIDI